MVRHFIASGPVSATELGVSEAAVSAGLVALGNIPSPLGTHNTRAATGTVDLSTVETSADQCLSPATLAKQEAPVSSSAALWRRP